MTQLFSVSKEENDHVNALIPKKRIIALFSGFFFGLCICIFISVFVYALCFSEYVLLQTKVEKNLSLN